MVDAAPLSATWIAALHATREDFTPLGAAVVIDNQRVLTSAHVVTVSGQMRPEVWVAFPLSEDPSGGRRRATVIRPAAHPLADLAVVELEDQIPAGVTAAPLRCPRPEDVVNRGWWAFGFASHDPRGNAAHGTVGAEPLGYGWVRLDTNSRYPVEPGFSGGGLWCADYGAVVGVVGQANDRGDGRAITLHQADAYLPAEGIRALTRWTVAAADEVARASWRWTLAGNNETDLHWRPRACGLSVTSERGHRFCGRHSALTEIVAWLDRPVSDRQVMVITGSPGVGKSAILGRIVTTADREMRAQLPADDGAVQATIDSVACAVHAKGKTALDVAREIARAASAPLPERVDDLPAGLQEALVERGGQRFNLVIDALDEASDPAQARAVTSGIVLPILETCADLGAQVVVGTRRHDDAGDLLSFFGPVRKVIDLDDSRYFEVQDLVAYAQATLQLRGDERAGNPYQADSVAAPVAARIAQLAEQNFLIAGLVARTHGLYDNTAIGPQAVSFTPSVESTLTTFVDRLAPVGGATARELLTALAFAETPGLPVELWQIATQALTGIDVTTGQLTRFAKGSAANFLVESAGTSANAIFRLFHQALSDALTAQRAVSPIVDEGALTEAFTSYGARIGWDRAPIYLFRSLPRHAVRAEMIDELLADTGYVLRADLRRLIPASARAHTPAGLQRAHVLRLTPRAIPAEPPERLALLSVTETLGNLGTAFRHYDDAAPYRGLWAHAPTRLERTVLEGHTDQVTGVCVVHVDGQELLASASDDRTVRIWDVSTGIAKRTLAGHTGRVTSVCAVRVDERGLLASASHDRTVRIWNPATGATERTLAGHTLRVNSLCVVRVDRRELLASTSNDATVRIWDPATGATERTLVGHTHWVYGVCAVWVHGRELLASASVDRTVRIWDPATGSTERTLTGHTDWVSGLCPVQVGGRELLASTGGDCTVRIWDPATGATVRIVTGHTDWMSEVCAVHVDGHELLAATSSASGMVEIWDPATGSASAALVGHTGGVNGACAVQVDGQQLLATASNDGTVRIWEPAKSTDRALAKRTRGVNGACTVQVDGQQLLATASNDGTVRIWDPATGVIKGTLHGHIWEVTGVCAVQVDGQELLASAGGDDMVRVWDLTRWRPRKRTLAGHTSGVTGVCAVRVNGHELLASASSDRTVMLWYPTRWRHRKRTLAGHTSEVTGVCTVRVDGHELLASASNDHTVRIWDLLASHTLHAIPVHHEALGLTSFNDSCLIVGLSEGLLALDITLRAHEKEWVAR